MMKKSTTTSFKKSLVAGLLLPVMLSACSTATEDKAKPAIPDMSASNIEAHLTFLADDAMKGRKSGTPEYMIAANYVAAQFKLLGLKPAGDGDSYFQTVNFQSGSVDANASSLSFSKDGKTIDLAYGSDHAPWLNMDNAMLSAAADSVVFAGYGSKEEIADMDLSGKVVMVMAGKRARIPGAAAVINLAEADFYKRNSFAAYVNFLTKKTGMLSPEGKMASGGYGDVLYNILSAEGTDKFLGLVGTDMAALKKAAAAEDFKPYTIDVGVKATTKATITEPVNSPNVVAVMEGSDPTLKSEYVIISAHLDHVGETCRMGKAEEGDTICNGAMDNASGISTMLEAAKAFSERPAPKRSVAFIALTAEEMGLLGAKYFSENPTLPIDKIVADVNLDMPILTYDFADVVAFGGEHSTIGEIAEKALAKIDVGLAVDPMPEQNLFTRSDHYMFVLKGVPSVFLMSGPNMVGAEAGKGLEVFEEFLANNYHSKADDLDQPLLYDVAAKFSLANYLIIEALANSPEKPLWYEGNKYGDKYAPDAKRAVPSERVKARAEQAEAAKKARMEKLKAGS